MTQIPYQLYSAHTGHFNVKQQEICSLLANLLVCFNGIFTITNYLKIFYLACQLFHCCSGNLVVVNYEAIHLVKINNWRNEVFNSIFVKSGYKMLKIVLPPVEQVQKFEKKK